jgi:hypothetical protein
VKSPVLGATDTLRWPARSSAPTTRNGSGGGSVLEAADVRDARGWAGAAARAAVWRALICSTSARSA